MVSKSYAKANNQRVADSVPSKPNKYFFFTNITYTTNINLTILTLLTILILHTTNNTLQILQILCLHY